MEHQENNDAQNENLAAVSIRDVDKKTWKNFRKLAMIHDMTIQDYLKYIVEKEMANVQVNK